MPQDGHLHFRSTHFKRSGQSSAAIECFVNAPFKTVITGGHSGTKVTIAGKAAKGAKLAAGMTCAVTYEGNLSVAKSIACK